MGDVFDVATMFAQEISVGSMVGPGTILLTFMSTNSDVIRMECSVVGRALLDGRIRPESAHSCGNNGSVEVSDEIPYSIVSQ